MAMHATFVLPAPNGCNLACPYCIIAQRKEAEQSWLTFEDYFRFLADVLTHLKVGRVSIQGFEPLLPEVWPTTLRLLKLSSVFFAQTGLVTNGTYLAENAADIAGLCDQVVVSLDSAQAHIHDKLRRVQGSFASARKGIEAALEANSGKGVIVNSVLLPGKADYLAGMPQLLQELGVVEWVISPMLSVEKKFYRPELRFVKETILRYSDEAQAYGVQVLLSDELRTTEEMEIFNTLTIRSLGEDDGIFRLSPDGSCSRGREILGLSSNSPKWDKVEQPSVFLRRIFADIDQPLRERTRWGSALARWNAGRHCRAHAA